MTALHRCGRRGEALAAYQRARQVLLAELGLEPGAALRQVQRAILTDEPPAASAGWAPAAGGLVPAQLPADISGFTGRGDYLRRLDELTPATDEGAGAAVVISAIAGTAGVGKTALALHWAHRVADRFPDGQLYVNLGGWSAGPPVQPVEVLARFLRALGVPPEQVPVGLDEAGALYRSRLAGKRMLVVLDNARDPGQVRPLLPASPGCLALVTSRSRLTGLVARDGATALTLDVLTGEEARALLAWGVGESRVRAEPRAAAALVRLCGHLPLAVRIAAANLSSRPHASIAEYAAQLDTDRLRGLEVDDDPAGGLRAAFDLSYDALPADARRLFRLLGLCPGPDVTAQAAAALAGGCVDHAARLLRRLAGGHLVHEHAPGRHSLHDLLRSYAAALVNAGADATERETARRSLYEFYLHGVDAAARVLYPQVLRVPARATGTTVPITFADHAAAVAWLDAERPNLVAVVARAAGDGLPEAAWRLADALRGYLFMRMHMVQWQAVASAGLAAARADEDRHGEAAAHISLAVLAWTRHQHGDAIGEYERALELARQANWAEGESVVHGNLGNVYGTLGQLTRAADCYRRALAIDQRLGWVAGQATKLANLAELYAMAGQLQAAADHHQQTLALYRQSGSHSGEGEALTRLGMVHHALGRYDDARQFLTQALAVHRHFGNVQALADYQQALDLARTKADPYVVTDLMIGLAAAQHRTGHAPQAIDTVTAALAIAREYAFRVPEARALTTLAATQLHQGNPQQALQHAERALATYAETGHRLGQAQARLVLGQSLRQLGNKSEADEHHRQAHDLISHIGADTHMHDAMLGHGSTTT